MKVKMTRFERLFLKKGGCRVGLVLMGLWAKISSLRV